MPGKKTILLIMDGWGLGKTPKADAVQAANTPFVDSLYHTYPHTTLATCGEDVGLPEGQMGNSEVGHLNLGAGRVVYQELQRINVAIREGLFEGNPQLLASIYYALENKKPLHLIGLVSDGGVHSHINHVKTILDVCNDKGLKEVYIHAFTDGRDCDPKSGAAFLKELENYAHKTVGRIASISGRYFAMDRDNRWERVQLAYKALVLGEGEAGTSASGIMKHNYLNNITDEFIKPTIILDAANKPTAVIKDADAVLCFNFRTDRCREITKVLTQTDFPEFNMHRLTLHYTTMAEYDASFVGVHVIFNTDNLNNTLGEVIEQNELQQLRMAETEKYPHVTFFFSGGREQVFIGENRIMAASPKVATYDLQPEMSAPELTNAVITEIEKGEASFICLNYANADMVGHTGIWKAVIKAVETVDACVQRVVTAALQQGYTVFLTADHGNADYMINNDGTPNTAHTLNPVPLFIIDREWRGSIKKGKLGDIAPTILTLMGLPVPVEMTGEVLIS
ncbi:MAG: 2,3-bisphosphoglycerate-independent phosphoglycerate mutase [Chitinophagaceae bacterium]